MRGYIQVVSTLLFFAVLYWLATRSSRRARKAQRAVTAWQDPPLDRLEDVERVSVHHDDWLNSVEERLRALERERAPIYRVQ